MQKEKREFTEGERKFGAANREITEGNRRMDAVNSLQEIIANPLKF